MSIITVEAKTDFLQVVSKDNPYNALAEIVWNGFDASSDIVKVFTRENGLGALESIEVHDAGTGIDPSKLKDFFGGLGGSWKKQAKKLGNKVLHGEKGRGRFKAYAIGERVEWHTKFNNNSNVIEYVIKGDVNSIAQVSPSVPVITKGESGTIVTILNPIPEASILLNSDVKENLAKIFCFFLTKFPKKKLFINNLDISPSLAQKNITEYNLGDTSLDNGRKIELKISIIEWHKKADRVINFCDENGFSLGEYKLGQRIRAPNCDYSIYASSSYFSELNDSGVLETSELDVNTRHVVEIIIDKAREHFLQKTLIDKSRIVEEWKKEDIYPYNDESQFNPVEDAERKVFDILAVNVQSYLRKFEKADKKTKQFTFKLLKQAIKDNPDSVQK